MDRTMNKPKIPEVISIWQKCLLMILTLSLIVPMMSTAHAEDSVCAQVKIIIEQKLSLERQAFDAKMVINNGLPDQEVKDVKVELLFYDRNNQPVEAVKQGGTSTGDEKFFYREDSFSNIGAIDGSANAVVTPQSSAEIHWMIIPSVGASGASGTTYYIGAKVTYMLNGQEMNVEVTPDYVVVKPLPLLVLDYFLPSDVYADDPFTEETEEQEATCTISPDRVRYAHRSCIYLSG